MSLEDSARDRRHLLDRLPLAENHLGESLSQGSVVVHPGETQVLIGEVSESRGGIFRRCFPRADVLQQFQDRLSIHCAFRSETDGPGSRTAVAAKKRITKTATGQRLSAVRP
jgi:hypothetical protein